MSGSALCAPQGWLCYRAQPICFEFRGDDEVSSQFSKSYSWYTYRKLQFCKLSRRGELCLPVPVSLITAVYYHLDLDW